MLAIASRGHSFSKQTLGHRVESGRRRVYFPTPLFQIIAIIVGRADQRSRALSAHVYFHETNLRSLFRGSPPWPVQTVTRIFPPRVSAVSHACVLSLPFLSYRAMYLSTMYLCTCVRLHIGGGVNRFLWRRGQ